MYIYNIIRGHGWERLILQYRDVIAIFGPLISGKSHRADMSLWRWHNLTHYDGVGTYDLWLFIDHYLRDESDGLSIVSIKRVCRKYFLIMFVQLNIMI